MYMYMCICSCFVKYVNFHGNWCTCKSTCMIHTKVYIHMKKDKKDTHVHVCDLHTSEVKATVRGCPITPPLALVRWWFSAVSTYKCTWLKSMNHNSLGCEQPYITHRPRCKNGSHPMYARAHVPLVAVFPSWRRPHHPLSGRTDAAGGWCVSASYSHLAQSTACPTGDRQYNTPHILTI